MPTSDIPGLPEKFILEGTTFNRLELLDYCRSLSSDDVVPQWRKEVYSFIRHFLDLSTGDIPQKTSGTTGDPREHMLNRYSMIRSAERTLAYFGLEPGSSVLLCLPVEYIAGKMMVVRALVGQMDLLMVEPSGRPLKEFREKAGFASMVPLQVYESLLTGDRVSSLDILLVGGGELHQSLREQLRRMERPRVYESFGMTETYTHFALKRINGDRPDAGFHPLSGITIRTDDKGCLEVDVPGVTAGTVTTRDLVEMDPFDGSFRWLGRYDNVISTGGIKVIPEMVEEWIRRLTGLECLLLPEKDPRLGERLVLVVEANESMPDTGQLENKLQEVLPRHELPRRIVRVTAIPRNRSLKPDRHAARRLI